MLNQKLWKIKSMAERMSNLAYSIAAEAARQKVKRQQMTREQATIAEETRTLSMRLLDAAESGIFGNLPESGFDAIAEDITKKVSFLALNTAFVSCKLPEFMPVAVFAEELLNIWRELSEALGDVVEFTDIPTPSPRSRVIPGVFYLLRATSGDTVWCENAQLVTEVLDYCPEFIQDNRLVIKNAWRDLDIPFIKLGEVAENRGIVIIADAIDKKKYYAVYASVSVHCLANSYVGVNKPYTGDMPVRECWAASDSSELIFPDWEKISLER